MKNLGIGLETIFVYIIGKNRLQRTVVRSAELGGNDGLYGRQTGKVAERPPLMIFKSRQGRDQLKFISVHRLRSSDGEDLDTSDMC